MAEKKMTVAEILAKRKEFEEMLAAQLEAERPSALVAVKEQINPNMQFGMIMSPMILHCGSIVNVSMSACQKKPDGLIENLLDFYDCLFYNFPILAN